MNSSHDVIDLLVGVVPGDPIDIARKARPEARTHADGSFLALFQPEHSTGVTETERFAVAAFVANLHSIPQVIDFYRAALERSSASNPSVPAAVMIEAEHGRALGPYGKYPAGPLEIESVAGPAFSVDASVKSYVLGNRLSAALEHAHFLILHPRDASPRELQRLLDAGWSTTEIVTLSQLISFLAYQIRIVSGLTVLKGAIAP